MSMSSPIRRAMSSGLTVARPDRRGCRVSVDRSRRIKLMTPGRRHVQPAIGGLDHRIHVATGHPQWRSSAVYGVIFSSMGSASCPNIFFTVVDLTSLECRRDQLSRSFFQDISQPSSCLYHLLPLVSTQNSHTVHSHMPYPTHQNIVLLLSYALNPYQVETDNNSRLKTPFLIFRIFAPSDLLCVLFAAFKLFSPFIKLFGFQAARTSTNIYFKKSLNVACIYRHDSSTKT